LNRIRCKLSANEGKNELNGNKIEFGEVAASAYVLAVILSSYLYFTG
jgi:hypothetical protein